MADLKPCPFCGGRPHFEYYGEYSQWGVKHTCKGGKGNDKRLWIFASGFDSLEAAIKVWNRRVDAAQGTNAITNEDRICGARGRELAKVLWEISGDEYCKNLAECGKMLDETGDIPDEMCIGCLERWLKQKVEEENK